MMYAGDEDYGDDITSGIHEDARLFTEALRPFVEDATEPLVPLADTEEEYTP